MKQKLLLVLTGLLLITTTGIALDAAINPGSQDEINDIVLNSTNDYTVFKTFDGSGSIGDDLSYSWNNIDTSDTDTGTEANFTFDRDGSSSNTIRLTVSNGTDSDVMQVTQFVEDVPNATITASSTSVETGETVSFSSSVTNAFDDPVTYAWKIDGTNQSAGNSFTFSQDSARDYTVALEVEDNATNNASSNSITISVTSPSDDSSDGGDDGGGGGDIGSDTGTDPSDHAQVFNEVSPAKPAVVSIDKEDQERLGVRKVQVNVASSVNDITITVSKQDGQPADVSKTVNKQVYRYLDIGAENLQEGEIDGAVIQFEINKTWIDQNNINRSRVRLQRYHEGSWNELSTEFIESTADKYRFNATTPGFSYFAVTGEENQVKEVDDTSENETDTCGNNVCEEGETWQSCPADCDAPENVRQARQSIQDAENVIGKNTSGYEKLQEARSALENGNYEQAKTKAEEALQDYKESQKESSILLPAILLLVLLAVIVVAYFNRERIQKQITKLRDQRSQKPKKAKEPGKEPGRDKRDIERRLRDVSTRVKQELETGNRDDGEELYRLLNKASQAVKEDRYTQADQILDRVDQRLNKPKE